MFRFSLMGALSLLLLVGCASPNAEVNRQAGGDDIQPEWLTRWYEYITPGAEHEQLKYFAGEWQGEATAPLTSECSPGAKSSLNMRYEVDLGGLFLLIRSEYESAGCTSQGFGAKGFNKSTGQFEWFYAKTTGSGMSLFTGTYDKSARAFTWTADVPSEYGPMPTRIVERIVDDNTYEFDLYQEFEGKQIHKAHILFRRRG